MKAEKKAAAAACIAFSPNSDPEPQAFPASKLFSTTLDIPLRYPGSCSLVPLTKEELKTSGLSDEEQSQKATSLGGSSCQPKNKSIQEKGAADGEVLEIMHSSSEDEAEEEKTDSGSASVDKELKALVDNSQKLVIQQSD